MLDTMEIGSSADALQQACMFHDLTLRFWASHTCAKDGNLDVAALQGLRQSSNEDVHTFLFLQPANVAKERHRCIHLGAYRYRKLALEEAWL